LAAGVPGPGVVVEEVKEVKEDFKAAWNIRKQHKNVWFPALIDLKNAENTLTKYTPKTFLRNTLIVKFKIKEK
jgi:hypothetical protein